MGMVIEHVQATNVRDHIVLGMGFSLQKLDSKADNSFCNDKLACSL
jgi:hypothetical protein